MRKMLRREHGSHSCWFLKLADLRHVLRETSSRRNIPAKTLRELTCLCTERSAPLCGHDVTTCLGCRCIFILAENVWIPEFSEERNLHLKINIKVEKMKIGITMNQDTSNLVVEYFPLHVCKCICSFFCISAAVFRFLPLNPHRRLLASLA
jgi:hypothetical protein